MPTRQRGQPAVRPGTFHQQGTRILSRLRDALATVIADVGMDGSHPQEISRRLSVDKNLAWRVARFVRDDDAWSAVPQLPGKAALGIFIAAARRVGAPEESFDAVRDASDAFEEFVKEHSGDRDTFVMMAGSISARVIREQSEAHRRLAFRGQSAVWGVQVRTHFSTHIVVPSEKAGMIDLAVITGFVDFRRLRNNVRWTMSRIGGYSGQEAYHAIGAVEPLVASGKDFAADAFVLDDFSTSDRPPVRLVSDPEGIRGVEIGAGPIGNTGSVTCVAAVVHRRLASMFKSEKDRFGEHLMTLSTPAEAAVFDLLVHNDFARVLPPELTIHSNLPSGQAFSPAQLEQSLLPVGEELSDLGSRPPVIMLPEMPTYGRLIRFALDKLGVAEGDFHGHRMRLRYPPIPSLAMLRYPLLEPGR